MMGGVAATLPSVFLVGLAYGASACMLACLPGLGGAALVGGDAVSGVAANVVRFNLGRMLGYTLLGAVSGGLGASIAGGLDAHQSNLAFGALMALSGVLLWMRGSRSGGCGAHRHAAWRGSLVAMGFGMSLTPCAPLAAVCAAAAASGSAGSGALLAFFFALGATLPAQAVFGHGMAMAGAQLRAQLARSATAIGRVVAACWIGLGAMAALGWVHLA